MINVPDNCVVVVPSASRGDTHEVTARCACVNCFNFSWAQQGTGASSKPFVIQGSGCVESAVESSCLVERFEDRATYNLLFADHLPAAGTAIRFKGTEHQGMTTCLQGKPVNVTSWKRVKGNDVSGRADGDGALNVPSPLSPKSCILRSSSADRRD